MARQKTEGRRRLKIRKGDKVRVIVGRDIGKEGEVERVLPNESRAVVAGINLLKKYVRKRGEREPGGIVTVAAPIHLSNLMLICPKCGKPTRIGGKTRDGGKKVRICRRCGGEIDSPKTS